jgi:acetolactate synthase-1/2/3 large subunit
MKVSDYIAEFLERKGIRHVFGIIGAGNAHLFDSITRRGFTEIVCVHHEQAAVMAMQTYYRTSGVVTATILTTGGGSTNATTGVVGAWADSIPGMIISGNENSKFASPDNPLRMWGVQGYDSSGMAAQVTKYHSRVMDTLCVGFELEKGYHICQEGRPGPVWIDIPMNIQSSNVDEKDLKAFTPEGTPATKTSSEDLHIAEVAELLQQAERPLLWLGHGIRLAGAIDLIEPLLEATKAPALVTWAGVDIADSDHPQVYGRAGVYGQRAANFVLQNCDFLLCIGTRLAVPQVGYDLSEFARGAKVAVVDVDPAEATKHGARVGLPIIADAKAFLEALLPTLEQNPVTKKTEWIEACDTWRSQYPWISADYVEQDGFLNSYPVLSRLCEYMKDDSVVVTDMGTALLSGHQIMRFKKGQRMMTSTGLGEMGFGLPGAVGASFARERGEVICLNCDGGMMMNLQELQTVAHHRLPIKTFIFNNDGYLMIKHTQKALFKGNYSGTDERSGVSCPDFSKVAAAFNMPSFQIRTWEDFEKYIPEVMAAEEPVICEIFMHPEQLFSPKLSLAVQPDGSLVSPPLEDLSPLLPRSEVEAAMRFVPMHEKSRQITL